MHPTRLLALPVFAVLSTACAVDAQAPKDDPVGEASSAMTILPPPSGTAQIAFGTWNACAVSYAGAALCWGPDNYNQLGIGYSLPVGYNLSPRQPWGLDANVSQVAVGEFFACALKTDQTVWCWGQDITGNASSTIPVPNQVALPPIKQIAAGDFHACALATDGRVLCWGGNSAHQAGPANASPLPPNYQNISNVTQLALGADFSCALLSNGTVQCWGGNSAGQLGTGDLLTRAQPTTLPYLGGVTQISAHGVQACARISDGTAKCWGTNAQYYSSNPSPTVPTAVPGLSGAVRVAVGNYHACAVQSQKMSCWGNNFDGQLGNGTFSPSATPVTVSNMTNAWSVAAGMENTCVITGYSPTQVYCWGFGGGELNANGTYDNKDVPTLATQIVW